MKRQFLLSFFVVCFTTRAIALESGFTFECDHVRPSEVTRVLRSLTVTGVSIKVVDQKVVVTGGSASLHKKMQELAELVDAPRITVRPRFIKLRFADVAHVAGVISMAFPVVPGNEELPLQAVPNTRTNEVLLMGAQRDVQAAEALVRLLDRAQVPPPAGCGAGGF